jgi:hypothetical protein
MESDSFEIFKQNPTKTWHYILAPVTPRPQQNQGVMSRAQAQTVEDGLEGRSSGRGQGEIISALMKNPDVLLVAEGLTWEKLRPVASAPNKPPEPDITPGAEASAGEANGSAPPGPSKSAAVKRPRRR